MSTLLLILWAQCLQLLDDDEDSSVTYDEFSAAVREDPRILECFGALFGVHTVDTASPTAPKSRKRSRHRKRVDATWEISSTLVGASPMASSSPGRFTRDASPHGSQSGTPKQQRRRSRSERNGGVRAMRRISVGHASEVVDALRKFQTTMGLGGGLPGQTATHVAISVRNAKLSARLRDASRDLRSDMNVADMRLSDWVHSAMKRPVEPLSKDHPLHADYVLPPFDKNRRSSAPNLGAPRGHSIGYCPPRKKESAAAASPSTATPIPKTPAGKRQAPRPKLRSDGSFHWQSYVDTAENAAANASGTTDATNVSLNSTADLEGDGNGGVSFGTPISSFIKHHVAPDGRPALVLPSPVMEGESEADSTRGSVVPSEPCSPAQGQVQWSNDSPGLVVPHNSFHGANPTALTNMTGSWRSGTPSSRNSPSPPVGSVLGSARGASGVVPRLQPRGTRSPPLSLSNRSRTGSPTLSLNPTPEPAAVPVTPPVPNNHGRGFERKGSNRKLMRLRKVGSDRELPPGGGPSLPPGVVTVPPASPESTEAVDAQGLPTSAPAVPKQEPVVVVMGTGSFRLPPTKDNADAAQLGRRPVSSTADARLDVNLRKPFAGVELYPASNNDARRAQQRRRSALQNGMRVTGQVVRRPQTAAVPAVREAAPGRRNSTARRSSVTMAAADVGLTNHRPGAERVSTVGIPARRLSLALETGGIGQVAVAGGALSADIRPASRAAQAMAMHERRAAHRRASMTDTAAMGAVGFGANEAMLSDEALAQDTHPDVALVEVGTRRGHCYEKDELLVAQVAAQRRQRALAAAKRRHFSAQYSRLARPITAGVTGSRPQSRSRSRSRSQSRSRQSRRPASRGVARPGTHHHTARKSRPASRSSGRASLRGSTATSARPQASHSEDVLGKTAARGRNRGRPRTSHGGAPTVVRAATTGRPESSLATFGGRGGAAGAQVMVVHAEEDGTVHRRSSRPQTSAGGAGRRGAATQGGWASTDPLPRPHTGVGAHSAFSPAHTRANLHREHVASSHGFSRPHALALQLPGELRGKNRRQGLQRNASSLSVSGVSQPLLDPFTQAHGW